MATDAPVETADQFGYEWSRYPHIHPEHEQQFLKWISPLTPSDLWGRSILDVGCGTGRNAYWAARYGASRVVACDTDERTVAVARRNLASTPNVEVVKCSVYDLPWRDTFDVVMSIGVIHHLENPRRAVEQVTAAATRGGIILIWVYAREGNERLLTLLGPLRRLTARLPPPLTDALAYAFSVPLWLLLRLKRPRHPYYRAMRRWRFEHAHQVVFDQLLPRIAHYWTRDEAIALFNGLPVSGVEASHTNENSWTLRARRVSRMA